MFNVSKACYCHIFRIFLNEFHSYSMHLWSCQRPCLCLWAYSSLSICWCPWFVRMSRVRAATCGHTGAYGPHPCRDHPDLNGLGCQPNNEVVGVWSEARGHVGSTSLSQPGSLLMSIISVTIWDCLDAQGLGLNLGSRWSLRAALQKGWSLPEWPWWHLALAASRTMSGRRLFTVWVDILSY